MLCGRHSDRNFLRIAAVCGVAQLGSGGCGGSSARLGDAELPADFLDHCRLYGCARLRLFAKLALLSAQLSHVLDGLLFGLSQLLNLPGEFILGQRPSPEAIDHARQPVEVYPELAQRLSGERVRRAGERKQ